MSNKTIVRPEDTERGDKRLAMFLTAEDALMIYQLLNGAQLHDARGERLTFLIQEHYEDTFEERLTEPWEWAE